MFFLGSEKSEFSALKNSSPIWKFLVHTHVLETHILGRMVFRWIQMGLRPRCARPKAHFGKLKFSKEGPKAQKCFYRCILRFKPSGNVSHPWGRSPPVGPFPTRGAVPHPWGRSPTVVPFTTTGIVPCVNFHIINIKK